MALVVLAGSGPGLPYRAYFDAFSEVLLARAAKSPSSLTFDAAILKMLNVADLISSRRVLGGAEYIYKTMRLLMKLGTLDADNNLRVHRLFDNWKSCCRNYVVSIGARGREALAGNFGS